MKNDDDQCFKWAITRALNPKEEHPKKIDKQLRKQAEELSWSDINFPVNLTQIDKFEKNNTDIYVNVFGYEEDKINVLRHTKQKEAIDFLVISDGKKTHYCWIKNFNRLMARGDFNAMHYCKRCLNGFTYQDGLINHQIYCFEEDAIKREMPKPDTRLKLSHYNRYMKVPFVIYADFESCIKPIDTCTPNPKESYTKKIQEHTAISFVIYVKSYNDSIYKSRIVTFTAKNEVEDVGNIFVDKLDEIVKNICHEVKTKKYDNY